MGRKLPAAFLASRAALLLPGVAAAGNGGFAPPPPASPGAERIADVYWLLSAIGIVIFVVVFVPLAVFVVRYRSRGRPREVEAAQVHGNTNLELAWTIAPVLILAVIAGYVFYKLPGIVEPGEAAAAPADLQVRVEGRQFYWHFEYENGVVAADRLRLPLDRTAELAMTSPPADVIHSFWPPRLAGKRDVVPGAVTRMKVRPTETGVFRMLCGEFCGVQHAAMAGVVEVVPGDEFDRWLDEQADAQEAGTSELGRDLWLAACAKCHGRAAEGLIGPPLAGNTTLANREALEEIVRNGRGAMPAVGEGWSEREFEALFAFVSRRFGGAEAEDDGDGS